MQTLSFEKLKQSLAAAGVARSVASRIADEIGDHIADAEAAAIASGMSPAEARRSALLSLGSADSIVAAVAAQPALLDWRHRWPQSARCVDSLAYCAAIPVAPFVYCCAHPASVARWGLSSSLAACVTASLLLAMQWMVSGLP